MRFNISKQLDFDKLNNKLYEFHLLQKQIAYIFVSRETLKEMMGREVYNNDNKMLFYQGHKIFVDQELKYGEVELR